MSKITKIILLCSIILLLAVSGFLAYRYLFKNGILPIRLNNIIPEKASAQTLIPDYAGIRKIAMRGNEKWVVARVLIRVKDGQAKYYSQKDGIPGAYLDDVINFEGNIWVSSQGGVGKLNDKTDKFVPYLQGESNIYLFEDEFAHKLYASTFVNAYVLNGDRWEQLKGSLPINSSQIIFTEKNAFSYSYPTGLVILDKKTDQWSKSDIATYGENQGLMLFKVNNRVFIFSRSAKYSGCSEYQKEAAAVFLEYKNGVWEPIEVLNQKFFNYEPSILNGRNFPTGKISFSYNATPCSEENSEYRQADFEISDSDIKLLKDEKIESLMSSNFSDTVQELHQILGLAQSHSVVRVLNGQLYTNASNNFGSSFPGGFSALTYNSDKYLERIIIPSDQLGSRNYLEMIDCGDKNQQVLLAQDIEEKGGSTLSGKLFSINNGKATEITGVSEDVTKKMQLNSIVCKNNYLYFRADNTIEKLNLTDYGLKTVVENIDSEFRNTSNQDNRLWLTKYEQLGKILVFDPSAEKMQEITVALDEELAKDIAIVNATDDKLILFSYSGKKLIITDYQGKQIKSIVSENNRPNMINIRPNLYLGSDSKGIFTFDLAKTSFNYLGQDKLPVWGTPSNFMPSNLQFSLFNDKDNRQVWFDGGSLVIFPLSYAQLGLN